MSSKAAATSAKRLKLSVPRPSSRFDARNGGSEGASASSSESGDQVSEGSSASGSEADESVDEDEIRALNRARHGKRAAVAIEGEGVEDLAAGASEKTKKRKRRATSPTSFGASLSTLLAQPSKGPATSSATSRIAARQAKQEEEQRLKKQQSESKHVRLERGHVRDVIGGWGARPARPFSTWAVASGLTEENEMVGGGPAGEKALKRLAQKGVVKLFNAIRAAQGAAEDEKDRRLSGAQRRKLAKTGPTSVSADAEPLPAVQTAAAAARGQGVDGSAPVAKRQSNALGSIGQSEALANLSKASFLELIKAGGR